MTVDETDTTPETPAAEPESAHDVALRQRARIASRIVSAHCAYAATGGLIPVPALDVAASATVQLRMAAKLSDLYELPFQDQAVKSAIGVMLAAGLPRAGIGYSIFSLVKGVPVVGTLLGIATIPALNAAVTWALGRVLIWHFERGGALETLASDEAIARFKKELRDARKKFGATEARAHEPSEAVAT